MRTDLLGVASLLAAALPAQAQAPISPPSKLSDLVSMRAASPEDIVVTAPPPAEPAEVQRQARAISRVDGSVLREPLAAFRSRICPGVIGLPPEMAELIVGRIRYNAERIGLAAADETVCKPNIIVAFVVDGRTEVNYLVRNHPESFADFSPDELKELLANPGPVYAWTQTAIRSRHGDELIGRTNNLVDVPRLNVANSHSHIFNAHRVDIDHATVLINLAAIDGLSLSQIADYVTMRSFARTRPSNGNAAGTILSLFNAEGAPPGLTTFDLAYLKSIYEAYDSVRALAPIAATALAVRRAETD